MLIQGHLLILTFISVPVVEMVAFLLAMTDCVFQKVKAQQLKCILIGGSTNIQVFVNMTTTMLPSAIEWIGRDKFGFTLMYDVIRAIPTLLKFQMSRGRKKCGEGEGEGGGEGSSEGDLGEEMEEELDHSTSVAQASKPAISSYRAAGAG